MLHPQIYTYFLISSKTISISSGFTRYPVIPASMAAILSSSKALAVMARIGIRPASGRSSPRMARVAPRPSMTGIRISMSTAW